MANKVAANKRIYVLQWYSREKKTNLINIRIELITAVCVQPKDSCKLNGRLNVLTLEQDLYFIL